MTANEITAEQREALDALLAKGIDLRLELDAVEHEIETLLDWDIDCLDNMLGEAIDTNALLALVAEEQANG